MYHKASRLRSAYKYINTTKCCANVCASESGFLALIDEVDFDLFTNEHFIGLPFEDGKCQSDFRLFSQIRIYFEIVLFGCYLCIHDKDALADVAVSLWSYIQIGSTSGFSPCARHMFIISVLIST